jgi:hypothetical protein
MKFVLHNNILHKLTRLNTSDASLVKSKSPTKSDSKEFKTVFQEKFAVDI